MIVAGRADISTLLQGNIDEINHMVIDFKKIKDIVTTETLIEVEVNMGQAYAREWRKKREEANKLGAEAASEATQVKRLEEEQQKKMG